MDNESEWWDVGGPEKENQENIVHNSPTLEKSMLSTIDHKVPIEKVNYEYSFDRKNELAASSIIFLIGLQLSWDYIGYNGYSYILDLFDNISWFIEYNYAMDDVWYEYNFLEKFGWLAFILAPLLLSINTLTMMYFYFKKELDIGKTTSYIHFSIFFIIIVVEFINWGIVPSPSEYGMGFNIILLSGFGFNPYTGKKISEQIGARFSNN